MRRTILPATIVMVLLAGPAHADSPDVKRFGWYTDYRTARAEAKRSGKPLMVVFRCEP